MIEIEGCLKQGVEEQCLILTTNDGKTYNLHGTDLPGLDKKLVVRAKGTEGGISTCMEGSTFTVTSWEWTRHKCDE